MSNLIKIGATAIAAAIAVTMTAGAASAITFGASADSGATYSEDGFTFSPYRIVNDNCFVGSCLALSDNETTTMRLGGDMFRLGSLGFVLLGEGTPNTLTVTGSNAVSVSFSAADVGHDNNYRFIYFFSGVGLFDDVTSITFASSGGGNVRIDDIGATPVSEVPLPAALPLLLAATGGLGFVGSRRRAARAA